MTAILNVVLVAGSISVLIGIVGVWRLSDSLGWTGNFVGGGMLILTGLLTSYIFGTGFMSVFSDPVLSERTDILSTLVLLALMWRIGWGSRG